MHLYVTLGPYLSSIQLFSHHLDYNNHLILLFWYFDSSRDFVARIFLLFSRIKSDVLNDLQCYNFYNLTTWFIKVAVCCPIFQYFYLVARYITVRFALFRFYVSNNFLLNKFYNNFTFTIFPSSYLLIVGNFKTRMMDYGFGFFSWYDVIMFKIVNPWSISEIFFSLLRAHILCCQAMSVPI